MESFRDVVAALRVRWQTQLPGRAAQRCYEPELAYGRHFAPPPRDSRRGAVFALWYPDGEIWRMPLTVRPETLVDHPGQVCLPGGIVEGGETSRETALRETREELGISTAFFETSVEVIGSLSPLYIFNSHVAVTPWLAVATCRPDFQVNSGEVARLLEIPLPDLLEPGYHAGHEEQRGGLRFWAPHFEWKGACIWGATGMILGEIATLVAELAA